MRGTYNGILDIYTCRLDSYLEINNNKKKRVKENRKAQHSNNNRKLEAAERITLKLEKTIYKGFEDIKIKSTIIIKLHTIYKRYQPGRLKETYIQSQARDGRNRHKSAHTAQGKITRSWQLLRVSLVQTG